MNLKLLISPFLFLALTLSAAQADIIKVSSFGFDTADKWEDVSSGSPMRKAELKYDAKGDNDPVAVFYHFGAGQGGGLEANINRWKGQFEGGPTKEEKVELDGGAILLVLSGTYKESSGGPFSGQYDQSSELPHARRDSSQRTRRCFRQVDRSRSCRRRSSQAV